MSIIHMRFASHRTIVIVLTSIGSWISAAWLPAADRDDGQPRPGWVEAEELPAEDGRRGRHPNELAGIAVDPKGKWIASCGRNDAILFWDPATLRELTRLDTLQDKTQFDATRIAVSDDGKRLACTLGGLCHVWAAEGAWRYFGAAAGGYVDSSSMLAFQPKSHLLAISNIDSEISLWDLSFLPFKSVGAIKTPPSNAPPAFRSERHLNALALHPSGNYLIARIKVGSCLVWDLRAKPWRLVESVDVGAASDGGVAISPDGKLVAVGPATKDNGGFYRFENERLVRLAAQPTSELGPIVKFSPDGKCLASADRFELRIISLDRQRPQEWGIDYGHVVKAPLAFTFLSGRKAIVVAACDSYGDNRIDIWDLSGERPVSLRATLAQKEKDKAEQKK